MSDSKVLDIDNFSKRSTQAKYPCIILKSVNETTPLVRSILEDGEVPLIGTHNGVKKVLKNISDSAYNIDKLLRTHGPIEYAISENNVIEVRQVSDYLEVFKWIY